MRTNRRSCLFLATTALMAFAVSCGGGPTSVVITAILINPGSVLLTGIGTELTVQAAITPGNATGSVTWRIENSAIATVAGNGRSAIVRAVSGGSTRVFASAGGVEGSANVVVTPAAKRITVSPPSASLIAGETLTLVPTLEADLGVPATLTWSSNQAAIATVTQGGVVTAVSTGSAIITVASTAFPSVKAEVNVAVDLPAVTVTLDPATANLFPGGTRQLTQTVTAAEGVAKTLTWSTDTPMVATVSQTGLVTAVGAGTATITARSTANPSAFATAAINVAAPRVTAIMLALVETLPSGRTAQATANVTADPGANTTLAWTSSNEAAATVSNTGVVTARAVGTTTITAMSQTLPAISASRPLTVTAPVFPMQWTASTDAIIGPAEVQATYNASAMLPDSTLIVVGSDGAIAERSKNGVWTKINSPTDKDLMAVVVAGMITWAAGEGGVVARRTPTGWVLEDTQTNVNISDIAMLANGIGFAVLQNNSGMIQRAPSGQWQPFSTPIATVISGPVLAIGPNGHRYVLYGSIPNSVPAFYRHDGTGWQPVSKRATSEGYGDMFLMGDGDLLFGGAQTGSVGFINRWTNGVWTREFTDPGPGQTARSAGSFSRCLDGTIIAGVNFGTAWVRSSGGAWNIRSPGSQDDHYSTSSCVTVDTLFLTRGNWLMRVDGTVTKTELLRLNFNRLGFSGGNIAFAGQHGVNVALHWNGATWRPFQVPSFFGFNLTGGPSFAAFGINGGFAVSSDKTAFWNGSSFDWAPDPDGLPANFVFGLSSNEIWTAGGELWRRSGGMWSLVQGNGVTVIHGASPDALFAAGANGKLGRWNGAAFTEDPPATTTAFFIDVIGFSASSAIAISSSELVVWDGSSWTKRIIPGLSGSLTTITGRSADEFYAFTSTGRMYGCSLTQCTLLQTFPSAIRVARIVGGKGMAVGDGGLVLHGVLVGSM